MSSIILKPGRDKPVRNRHPWIFSGAIANLIDGPPVPGEIAEVFSDDRTWLARAYINPKSQITARILSWRDDETIDRWFWIRRIEKALTLRHTLSIAPESTAYRLINAESDGLPGLIVDKYEDFLVVQYLTLGMDQRKELLKEILVELVNPAGIYERSDVEVRKLEGLSPMSGCVFGLEPPEDVIIFENGLRFRADVHRGHKTGLYLDQRLNHKAVTQQHLVAGRSVLNVFAYTGGFGIFAAQNGAESVIHIDDSHAALQEARKNARLNGIEPEEEDFITGNAFQVLREINAQGMKFDMVILDPPKFAKNQSQIRSACRGYKDINWLALKLLNPEGILATFSCSGLISKDLFQKVLFGAAVDADRNVQILADLAQSPDHPILLTFPESAYLKGFLCRVI